MLVTTVVLSALLGSALASSQSKRVSRHNKVKRTPGAPVTPSDWPTTTQAGAVPSATKASSSDPYLNSISDALNNNGNSYWTTKYTGDLTFYNTGSVACGDVYVDTNYIAAVSEQMWNAWPGATSNVNRHPICGPWTTGRSIQDASGNYYTAVPSSEGIVTIGGDGLPNCSSGSQCHIPMTATVTNPANGLSVVVQIVDQCGGCAMGDIDLSPTAFSVIADQSAGRVHNIQWSFNVMGSGAAAPATTSAAKTTSTTSAAKTTTTTSATKTTTTTSAAAKTTTAASSGACATVAAWSPTTTYVGTNTAVYNKQLWRANWWSLGDVPGTVAYEWTELSTC